ncbi:hypothetical protein N8475_00005 [Winogradskyella sp.]|nr:hypothetical protein [Winogradskyella sp.]
MEIDGMDDLNHILEINGYISFSNSYFTMSSKMRDLPLFETPLEDRTILGDKHWKATVVSYTESSIGEKIKFFIEYNGYNNEYNSDGGILIARYPEQKMKVIYPLNKSLD